MRVGEALQGNTIHFAVIALWMLELVLFPFWAMLDLGFGVVHLSNYVLRFSYLALFGLAAVYHLVNWRLPFFPALSLCFAAVLIVGGGKGLIEGNFTRAFLSHIFYVTMPIVMLSYGYYFSRDYLASAALQRLLRIAMVAALVASAGAVGLFIYGYQSGHAVYNAIGLWNGFFAGPFLLNMPMGALSLTVAVAVVVLAAKRGVMVGFAAFFIVGFLLRNRRLLWLAMIPAAIALLNYSSIVDFAGRAIDPAWSPIPVQGPHGAPERLSGTIDSIVSGDLEGASSGRLSEMTAAASILLSRFDHMLLGAGFGAQFVPWPASPDYLSHYSHFTPLAYVWIGGIFMPAVVYGSILLVGGLLCLRARKGGVPVSEYFVIYWLFGIVALSMLGAVLMNNSWLWLIFGWAYGLLNSTNPVLRPIWGGAKSTTPNSPNQTATSQS